MPNNIFFLVSFMSSMVVIALLLLAFIYWYDRHSKNH